MEQQMENRKIFDILKEEHRLVKKLLNQILDSGSYQDSIYKSVSGALRVHLDAEEKVFYSKLSGNPESRLVTLEAIEEHNVARKVMDDVDAASEYDLKFGRVKVLEEVVSKHVENEEGDVYKKAKKVLTDEQEREIGRQFLNEKKAKM